jgi:serine/threonine protein kinase
VQIAIDVLTAVQFLHVGSKDAKISSCFHRDIKSANIVIKRDFTAQLIDCGIAKFVKDDNYIATSTGSRGTVRPGACSRLIIGCSLLEPAPLITLLIPAF